MGTYLSRTPGSAGNRKTMTFSCWVKRSGLSSFQSIISAGTNGATYSDDLSFQSSDKIMLDLITTSGRYQAESSALFRDPSSWYHVVIAINTTAASNRMLVYVNNEQVAVNSGGIPQNQDITFNNNTLQEIGRRGSNSSNFGSYYLTDFNFIDGQALTPSTFGETDSTTGQWKPKVTFSGLTYGTNGFRLQFGNAAALGTDTSGQSNNFTVNNAGTNAKTVDTATNNFCTLNPLQQTTAITLSNGNLVATNTSNDQGAAGTMAFSAGKWYWEVKLVNKVETGINLDSNILQLSNDSTLGSNDNNLKQTALVTNSAGGSNDFRFNGSTETVNSTACSNGDILMVAVDADNTKIYYGKNGTWMNSGNPAGGSGELKNFSSGYTAGNFITPTFQNGLGSTASCQFNFGNPSYTIASGNADANGHGNFEYAVPSGYYALCTKNINQYG